MAKTKPSRIKRAEERIEALIGELHKMGHMLNLTMNTLNEYIKFNKDLKEFEEFLNKNQSELEKDLEKKEK